MASTVPLIGAYSDDSGSPTDRAAAFCQNLVRTSPVMSVITCTHCQPLCCNLSNRPYTLIPKGANSIRIVLLSAVTTAFELLYDPMKGWHPADRPAILLWFTTRPRADLRSGKKACVTASKPKT